MRHAAVAARAAMTAFDPFLFEQVVVGIWCIALFCGNVVQIRRDQRRPDESLRLSRARSVHWVTHRVGIVNAVAEVVRVVDPFGQDGLLPFEAILCLNSFNTFLTLVIVTNAAAVVLGSVYVHRVGGSFHQRPVLLDGLLLAVVVATFLLSVLACVLVICFNMMEAWAALVLWYGAVATAFSIAWSCE